MQAYKHRTNTCPWQSHSFVKIFVLVNTIDRSVLEVEFEASVQTCKKSGTWEPSSRIFLEKNPDIFQKLKHLRNKLQIVLWF